MYINNFGLVSYFKELLYSEIKVSNWFVILLDEGIKKITQQRQMDFCVRLCDEDEFSYLTSNFLGYSAASDFVHRFEHCEIGLFIY